MPTTSFSGIYCACGRESERRGASPYLLCWACHRRFKNCACIPMSAVFSQGRWIVTDAEYKQLQAAATATKEASSDGS